MGGNPAERGMNFFFSILAFFTKKIWEMNLTKKKLNLVFLSHASLFGATYKGVTPVYMARLATTVAPVVPRWFSHVRAIDMTHAQVTSNGLAWRVCIKVPRSSFSFFLLLSSVAVAPLAILEFSPPYEVCGALNRLQELISRSYWVRMPSLPSHLVIFQKFRLDELMW
jgi:hypothetical protein